MVGFVTADLVQDKFAFATTMGDVYQPADNWWLLITAETTDSLVQPDDLRCCLEN